MEIKNGEYLISTDKRKLDVNVIFNFIAKSYWGQGLTIEKVKRAIENSLCFGVYVNDAQIGFTRVITDFTGFAYIADVFILENFQGRGLSKWLMKVILEYPELQGLRRWLLATKDAHSLYKKFGFTQLENPLQFMELHDTKKFPY